MLREYGVHYAGSLAAVPSATVQRLLGGRAGRLTADRARGIDPRPVVPRALPVTVTVSRRFDRHVLDGAAVRTALLELVVVLGHQLRRRDQAARALRLTLYFAGGSRWDSTRRLLEASAHDEDLRPLAHRLMDAAALQRGRLTGLALKAEDLAEAGQVTEQITEQITLNQSREARLVAENAVDRVRARVIGPATVHRRAS